MSVSRHQFFTNAFLLKSTAENDGEYKSFWFVSAKSRTMLFVNDPILLSEERYGSGSNSRCANVSIIEKGNVLHRSELKGSTVQSVKASLNISPENVLLFAYGSTYSFKHKSV